MARPTKYNPSFSSLLPAFLTTAATVYGMVTSEDRSIKDGDVGGSGLEKDVEKELAKTPPWLIAIIGSVILVEGGLLGYSVYKKCVK